MTQMSKTKGKRKDLGRIVTSCGCWLRIGVSDGCFGGSESCQLKRASVRISRAGRRLILAYLSLGKVFLNFSPPHFLFQLRLSPIELFLHLVLSPSQPSHLHFSSLFSKTFSLISAVSLPLFLTSKFQVLFKAVGTEYIRGISGVFHQILRYSVILSYQSNKRNAKAASCNSLSLMFSDCAHGTGIDRCQLSGANRFVVSTERRPTETGRIDCRRECYCDDLFHSLSRRI